MAKRLNKEEVNNRLKKYNIQLLGDYQGQYAISTFQCCCGGIFNKTPKDAMAGCGVRCAECELQHAKRKLLEVGITMERDPPLDAVHTTKITMICFCGNKFTSNISLTLNRKVIGCGCTAKNAWSNKNVAGMKVNKLTVLKDEVVKNNRNQYCYECMCECGTVLPVLCQRILGGEAFSCRQCSKVHAANIWSLQRANIPKRSRRKQLSSRHTTIFNQNLTDGDKEQRPHNFQKIGRSAFTNEQVQERLDKYGLTLLSEYTRNVKPIKVRCKCGEEYETKFHNISRGKNVVCHKCEYLVAKNDLAKYGTIIVTEQNEYIGVQTNCDLICFCGKAFTSPLYRVLNGFYKGSCGCSTRIKNVDLAGMKFNNLTVLNNDFIRQNGVNYLECQCDCGRKTLIAHHYIVAKRIKRCNICAAANATKKTQEKNAQELASYLSRYGYTQLSPYRGTLRPVEVQCCCGKILKRVCKNLLKLARKNARLDCKCNKMKNGRMTSNPVFQLHNTLGRGVHNYNSKAGCIDIALCYKGKKIAIEYDEWWWHKDYKAKDDRKNKKLLDHGWFVLRLRVSGYLPTYQEMIHSLDKLVKSKTRFLARTHKSWRGYIKED